MLHVQRDTQLSVEEFVARMARCRVFVAVLTPSYWRRAIDTRHPSYVYDEVQVATRLPHLHTLALKRPAPPDQPASEEPHVLSAEEIIARHELAMRTMIVVSPEKELHFDRAIEATDDDFLHRTLQPLYRYDGPRLAPAVEAEVRKRARRAGARAAHDPTSDAELEGMAREHPEIGLLWGSLVTAREQAGDKARALDAARRGAAVTREWDGRVELLRTEVELHFQASRFLGRVSIGRGDARR